MTRLDELHVQRWGGVRWSRRTCHAVRTSFVAGVLLASSGCYSYTSVEVSSVPLGETVRARVSTDGQRDLLRVGQGSPDVLEGRLLENRREGVLLFVPTMTRQIGFRFETMSQRLLIPHEHLVTLDQRQLDKTRTVALLGVVGVTTGVALAQLLSGTSGSSGRPGGPDGPAPSIGFPMGWLRVR